MRICNFALSGGYCVYFLRTIYIILMRGIAVCSLAQLYSTNKHIPSFATAAKRSFILNSILNERLYC